MESYSEKWEALEVEGLKLKIEFSTLKDSKIDSETFFKEYDIQFNNFCEEVINQVKEGNLKKRRYKIKWAIPHSRFYSQRLILNPQISQNQPKNYNDKRNWF